MSARILSFLAALFVLCVAVSASASGVYYNRGRSATATCDYSRSMGCWFRNVTVPGIGYVNPCSLDAALPVCAIDYAATSGHCIATWQMAEGGTYKVFEPIEQTAPAICPTCGLDCNSDGDCAGSDGCSKCFKYYYPYGVVSRFCGQP